MTSSVLDPQAQRVASEVLAEEEQKRRHLVVALSGAHAYGFPSPDSDLDLKGIHVAPTRDLLGLSEPTFTSDRTGIVEGGVCHEQLARGRTEYRGARGVADRRTNARR